MTSPRSLLSTGGATLVVPPWGWRELVLGATPLAIAFALAVSRAIPWLVLALGVAVSAGFVAAVRLVRRSKARLAWLEARAALLADASGTCVWERRREGPDGVRETWWFAPAWFHQFGIEAGLGRTPERWFERVHPQDIGGLLHALERLETVEEPELRRQYRIRSGEEWRWFELYATRRESCLVGSIHDMTDAMVTRERLAHTAFHDPLTDLPNRALFLNRLAHCTARARRNPQYRFAVAFIDIDDFKTVNDSLGHHAGDLLLKEVGRRLAASARPGDTVARIGGDEFTLLFEPVSRVADAEAALRRIRTAVHGDVEIFGQRIRISTSVGIAVANGEQHETLDLLRDADTAMYFAKRLGPGRQQVFDEAMRATVVRRVQVEAELRNALGGEGGQLIVHYQPVIDLAHGTLQGFEALVRLRGASGRIISPSEFIPLAESQGLVDPIFDVVLDDACTMVSRWSSHHPDLYVSVNVSARAVHGALVDRVSEALVRHSLAPRHLKLELTESVLVGSTVVVTEALAGLRHLGVGLFIDDFGTGYSSLSYLHQFPADCIKLDRTFVMALDGHRTPDIVETIVSLSRRIGASVIAEGIETETQLRALKALGCATGQGFLFAPAVPAETATQLVEQHRVWQLVA
jgi:diguanylate cyclase (GGDEF)-like protein